MPLLGVQIDLKFLLVVVTKWTMIDRLHTFSDVGILIQNFID
jgi:hypothetical protein